MDIKKWKETLHKFVTSKDYVKKHKDEIYMYMIRNDIAEQFICELMNEGLDEIDFYNKSGESLEDKIKELRKYFNK